MPDSYPGLSRYIGLPKGSPLIAENGCIVEYRGEVHELCEDLNLKEVALRLMKLIPGLRPTYQFNYRKFDITLWAPGIHMSWWGLLWRN